MADKDSERALVELEITLNNVSKTMVAAIDHLKAVLSAFVNALGVEYQKNQAIRGLTHCRDEDIIIVSDTDEILRATKLPEAIALLLSNQTRIVSCDLASYTYFLNRQGGWGSSHGSWSPFLVCCVVTQYEDVKKLSLQGARHKRNEGHKESPVC